MKNPSIRFKSTSNVTFPDWEAFPLANFATLHNGRAYKQEELLETGKYPVLRVGNFFTNSKWYFSDLDLDQSKIAEDGDLLYAWSASFGPKIWTGQKVIYHYHIWKITTTDRIDKGFLYFLLQKDALALGKELNGGTMSHLTKASMEARCFRIPSGEEQQKIASFFSTLDQKIELNERKVEALEKLKKGLMQNIFNRKIRFKKDDGTDFPDWKVSELGNIAEIRGGGTPSTSNSDYWDGNIQWLTPTEIDSKYVHESNRKITESGLANSSAKLLPMGTILLTTRATLGACSINNFNGFVCTNQGFQSLVCKPIVLNEYVYYAITFDEFQKKITKHASGSTFLEISAKNLKKLTIPTPSLEEQRKIADLLSTLDLQIDIKKKTVSAMRDLKRGFMQQMFI